ncbi:MAG: hypothetical protein IID15_07610 [Candidatus Marinimicrobia bacterium]|nr:hypothetical protein [Candidatus Neomarinimicrobiota bacterium]
MKSEKIFQAEINYAYNQFVAGHRISQSEFFLVDAVPLEALSDFFELILGEDGDLEAMVAMFQGVSRSVYTTHLA